MNISESIKLRFVVLFFVSFLLCQFSIPVTAIGFNNGAIEGSLDTTLSYGQLYRVQNRADNLIGIANGGTAKSLNRDDGNLNYDSGMVSNTVKFTTEFDASYKSTGIFIRGFGFFDSVSDDTTRTKLDKEAKNLVGSNLVLRDAFLWHEFNLGRIPAEIRVGEQVLSWGESTFIQNSINTINPVDVSASRTPGAELREALIPVGMVSGSLGLTDNVSVEAYYAYDWEKTVIDPVGSYFSTNDFIGDGGTFVVAGQGTLRGFPGLSDYYDCPPAVGGKCALPKRVVMLPVVGVVPVGDVFTATRAANLEPGNGGEYGAAVRLYVPKLNNTEFGLYFLNYHSRLPIVNAIVGPGGAGRIIRLAAPVCLGDGGQPVPGGLCVTMRPNLMGTQYQVSYPDDIQLYGFSFNTEIGAAGITLQGEYSFRDGVPLQVDVTELLAAMLTPPPVPVVSQLGTFAVGDFVQGYTKRDVSQFQMTATKVFGNVLKADQAVLVGEWAITHIHKMPSKDELLLASPGISTSGNPDNAASLGHTIEELSKFPDATSWGYRIVSQFTYNNALFGSVNLQPRFSWRHDVAGISPGPGGNFLAGRKDVSVGLRASYQNQWEADFSYTSFLGDSRQNLLHDRDFVSATIKYSF